MEVETDGSLSPSEALHKAANILKDHFDKISAVEVVPTEVLPTVKAEATEKRGRKKQTKSE
jgi:DNA-directed RNA polymerase alpha subunit